MQTKPIKIIVEITDEVIDLCAFVQEVLDFEEEAEEIKSENKQF
jgi:hypothetical protein